MTVRISISMGDPTGIGPEIVAAAAADAPADLHLTVFGQLQAFERAGARVPPSVEWVEVIPGQGVEQLRPGQPDLLAGQLQVAALDKALDSVLRGDADALCTAPITKAAARAAGFAFPGHTELLARRTGTEDYAMMLAGPELRVVPLTGHLPLAEVASHITAERVLATLLVTAWALVVDFGLGRARIALAGLNPHAGERGMLGWEEQQVLQPALEQARDRLGQLGLEVELTGPLPADALFVPPIPFDAVVCCYHDQALIPLKMLHRDQGVNVTLGLPIVRTSPAHGTAADIAWQGRANPASMRAALALAAELVRRRRAAGD